MTQEKKLVKCLHCKWRVESYPDHNWNESPCRKCNNSRLVVDPLDILCNLCGETMCPIGTMNEQNPHGLFEAKVTGGYDSYHLFDLSTYKFSFCEQCLRKLFNQCKIKPLVYDTTIDGDMLDEHNWLKDQEAYEYRVWKDEGGHHQAYLDRKCNAVKNCQNEAIYTHLVSDQFTEDCTCEEHKEFWMYANSKLTKFIPNVLKPFL